MQLLPDGILFNGGNTLESRWQRLLRKLLFSLGGCFLKVTLIVSSAFFLGVAHSAPPYQPEPPIEGDRNPTLFPYYHQVINWHQRCLKNDMAIEYDCGYADVPIDYAHPEGSRAHIFLFRLKARAHKVATLFINPGGPGESGALYVANNARNWSRSRITENLDIIGFDPRGVGNSVPTVQCRSDAEMDLQRAQNRFLPQNVFQLNDYIQECVHNTGLNFLAHVSAIDVARDLDVIKTAVGDNKLTYLGKSYGTVLGQSYIEQFPHNVRAMVFDGVLDRTQSQDQIIHGQNEGFQHSLNVFAGYCLKKIAMCPLGNSPTPQKAVSHIDELINPLHSVNYPAGNNRELSYSDAVTGIQMAMYSPTLWPALVKGLLELHNHRGDTLMKLADIYDQRDPDGHYSNSSDVLIAVNCTDSPPAEHTICDSWPVGYRSVPHEVNAPGIPRMVVVSTTGDPATPYEYGVKLAQRINASLITFQGEGHLASLHGNACVDNAIIQYLITAVVPPSLVCR